MKIIGYTVLFFLAPAVAGAQPDTVSHFRGGLGLAAPELLHAGLSLDLGTRSQVGLAAGAGPSWGTVWPAYSVEHRFYFGPKRGVSQRRRWFFRQGATYFSQGNEGALTLSLGGDLPARRANRGWTIDVGGFTLVPRGQDRYRSSAPALRFQYYFYLPKRK